MLFSKKFLVFGLLFQMAILETVQSRILVKSFEGNVLDAASSKVDVKRNVFTNIGNGIEKAAQKIKEEAISAAKKTACSACVVSVGVVQYLLTHTKWFPVVVREACVLFFKNSKSFLCSSAVTAGKLYSRLVSPKITCGLTPICPLIGKRDLNGFSTSYSRKSPSWDEYVIEKNDINITRIFESLPQDFLEDVDRFISDLK